MTIHDIELIRQTEPVALAPDRPEQEPEKEEDGGSLCDCGEPWRHLL